MASQTDQLLLMYQPEEDNNKEIKANATQELADMREVLRLFTDLKNHRGYQLLLQALSTEAHYCLSAMDKAEGATQFTKYAANYYSLTHAVGYVDNEIKRLTALLASR